jgi:glycosyltransferase involved in cell wall biosynthesis
MKLSIVIPVYNVEGTLDRCVESVLHQGIDDFEVILVDDGSRDKSAAICDEWQAKDAHIRVGHQQNG